MKTEIMSKVSRKFYKTGLVLKKHSPEILAAAGVVGIVTSGVLACKATTKLSGILEESKNNIETIHDVMEHPEKVNDEYTQEDGKKDLAIVYVQTGVKLFKLYAPAVALGTLSITAMLTSNNILRKRNIALAAAYATVDKGFKEYRGRVIERFGEDLDKELKYNLKAKEIKETVVDEETGKKKTVKKTVHVADPNNYSPYCIVFDDGNAGWSKDPEHNKFFLIQQQSYANKMLQERGYLFLNEVYEMLGAPKTKAGQVVGWIYDEEHPVGDNYIDFGIFEIEDDRKRDFINGYERNIILDFNVDGNIMDLVW